MTLCESYIRSLIKDKGFVRISEWMDIALHHPNWGYYRTTSPLGSHADFITSPEVSPLFGDTICLWAFEKYKNLKTPPSLAILELGPGRGTLMADFLRRAQSFPQFFQALKIHLVDVNPHLIKLQRSILSHPDMKWHSDIDNAFNEIKNVPLLVIANEFFDVFPINQYQKTLKGWTERIITLDKKNNSFIFENLPLKKNDLPVEFFPDDLKINTDEIIEHCPLISNIYIKITQKLSQEQGALLMIDYGYDQGWGDTLQAVSRHQQVSLFENLGTIDITAHVNFGSLKQKDPEKTLLMTQRDFLFQNGIEKLVSSYMKNALPKQKEALALQFHKLVSTLEMGFLFKALEWSSLKNA